MFAVLSAARFFAFLDSDRCVYSCRYTLDRPGRRRLAKHDADAEKSGMGQVLVEWNEPSGSREDCTQAVSTGHRIEKSGLGTHMNTMECSESCSRKEEGKNLGGICLLVLQFCDNNRGTM